MPRYKVWRKGDKVRIIASTYRNRTGEAIMAQRKRQGVIYGRVRNDETDNKPVYRVGVRVKDDWSDSYYYNEYYFSADDLEAWTARPVPSI